MNRQITVIKRDPDGLEVIRYTGRLLHQEADVIVLEARFNRADMLFMNTLWKQDDRFVETYFTTRWYNIFEIHDRDDDHLKGWYCNISRPAVLESENRLSYIDLALDLWIAADGTQSILDQDEFTSLDLDEHTRSKARAALLELQEWFKKKQY